MNTDEHQAFTLFTRTWPGQAPLLWPEPPLLFRTFEIDNGRGGTYEIMQFPKGREPCYDDAMLLVTYDNL